MKVFWFGFCELLCVQIDQFREGFVVHMQNVIFRVFRGLPFFVLVVALPVSFRAFVAVLEFEINVQISYRHSSGPDFVPFRALLGLQFLAQVKRFWGWPPCGKHKEKPALSIIL